jgi:hypothetical protein
MVMEPENSQEEIVIEKRGRGRPRKEKLPTEPKKKGRPRKEINIVEIREK